MDDNVLQGFEDRAKLAEEKLQAIEKMLGAELSREIVLRTTAQCPYQ